MALLRTTIVGCVLEGQRQLDSVEFRPVIQLQFLREPFKEDGKMLGWLLSDLFVYFFLPCEYGVNL